MRSPYKDLSLNQLRTFREVCRLGSYAAAARNLGVTTSTVWEQMRGLDRYFETALLITRNKVIQPSAEGAQLLELSRPLLAGLGSMKEMIHQLRGRAPEAITLASGMRMLLDEVGKALPRFRKSYPNVRIRCLFVEDQGIERMVAAGEVDLGLMLEPDPHRQKNSSVNYESAYSRNYELIALPRHPLLSKRKLCYEDLLGHRLILGTPETSSRRRIEETLHSKGLLDQLKIAVETNSAALTYAYVRAGVGLGIAPGRHRSVGGLEARSLRHWFGEARYVFVWQHGSLIPPATRALADFIRNVVHD